MKSEKIIKAKNIGGKDIQIFAPEDGSQAPTPVIIRPDENGTQWYWTTDPEEPIAAE
jgi:hypothetical protein